MENEFDQDVISQSLTHTTKHWVSSDGGLGCFARANREILHAIAAVTGTNISISEDMRSLKVSGSNTGDVDDALAKLSRIEVPLVSVLAASRQSSAELTLSSQSRGTYARPTWLWFHMTATCVSALFTTHA